MQVQGFSQANYEPPVIRQSENATEQSRPSGIETGKEPIAPTAAKRVEPTASTEQSNVIKLEQPEQQPDPAPVTYDNAGQNKAPEVAGSRFDEVA